MKTATPWLLAGAAFTLCAGASIAAVTPEDAARQAREDARSAQADALRAQEDGRRARDDAQRARADAQRIRDEARRTASEDRQVRVYRQDGGPQTRIYSRDGDVVVIRGGGREEALSTMLQLRPEQQPALKAFLDATRNNHDDRGHDHMVRFDRGSDDRTTLQRLDDMQARAAEQKAEMDRKVAAVRTFYAQLDARQRKAFDAMPMLMMVGPNIGPMMIPGPMPIHFREPLPPLPPVPPGPPLPPRS